MTQARRFVCLSILGMVLFLSPASFAAEPARPARPCLVVGGDRSYPPYEFIDENGRPAGFVVDLTRALAEVMDVDVDIRLGPWLEVLADFQAGRIDVIQSIYYVPDREPLYEFTTHHTMTSCTPFTRHGEEPVSSFSDLRGRRVAVEQDDLIESLARNHIPDVELITVQSQIDALRAVASGRADYAFVSEVVGQYGIRTAGLLNLETAGPPLMRFPFCYAVAEGNTELADRLSEGLAILRNTGRYQTIQERWLGDLNPDRASAVKVMRYVVYACLPLIGILLISVIWSWSLHRQVARRTAQLRESEECFRILFDLGIIVEFVADLDGNIIQAHDAFLDLLGRQSDDLPLAVRDITPPEWAGLDDEMFHQLRTRGSIDPWEKEYVRTDGVSVPVLIGAALLPGREQLVAFVLDLSERKRLEEQLHQARKMEAVGTLAGGIAHDFNNILAIIIGNAELALEDARDGHCSPEAFEEIITAGTRGRDVVRQLLGFARTSSREHRPLALNPALKQDLKLTRATIPATISIKQKLEASPDTVTADPTQLHQLLINLCTNAAHAMEDHGGILTVQTANVTIHEHQQHLFPELKPGPHVRLLVGDTGTGIDPRILERIFDPYFTTKGPGRGTGMGLSVVHGIVRNHEGAIRVFSPPGRGTTVHVYLPLCLESVERPAASGATELPTGTEHILFVDDETAITSIVGRLIQSLGYTVTTRNDPRHALDTFREHPETFDLVLTDMSMPGMDGEELACQLLDINPDLPVILCTGYHPRVDENSIASTGICRYLEKPFDTNTMATFIREVLDGKG